MTGNLCLQFNNFFVKEFDVLRELRLSERLSINVDIDMKNKKLYDIRDDIRKQIKNIFHHIFTMISVN